MNLRSIDLNLLTIFEAVYEERSQVRAAQRLGMTQPAVSNAMNRLRSLTGGDRLFLGRAKGLVTTSKADDLYEAIHVALIAIRGVLGTRDAFDPATSRRTFSINISFGSGSLIGLRLFRRFREVAPNIRLVIRDIDPADEITGLLRTQRLDLAVHHARFDGPALEQSRFMSFKAVLIAREGHPRVDSAVGSMERLLEEEFVSVHHHAKGLAQNEEMRPILDMFHHRVVLEVPTVLMLPLVVSQTDLLALTSRQMAEQIAPIFGVRSYEVPIPIPKLVIYMIWHPSRRNDPAHRWLREQCLAVAEELQSLVL